LTSNISKIMILKSVYRNDTVNPVLRSDTIPPSSARIFAYVAALLLLASSHAFAQETLEKRVKEYTLDNGLRIIVLQRAGSPSFAAYIRFLVGGIDEEAGQSGTAHILEHMLFKGSENIGTLDFKKEEPLMKKAEEIGRNIDTEVRKGDKGDSEKIKRLKDELGKTLEEQRKYIIKDEISSIYQRGGGSGFNAFTSQDTTTYLVKLPSNKFELWAWIESDRLRSPVLREYYSERDVVLEERRRSVDNSPSGTLYEQYGAAAFQAHPYGNPIIGWSSDISLLPKDKVRKFLQTYYSPGNMVICIVGDIEPDYAYNTIRRYFGDIPRQEIPDRVGTKEPMQKGERRIMVEFDANPEAMIGFHKPPVPHKDDYVFDVINYILTSGRTGRLYRSLVLEKGIAVSVDAWTGPGDRGGNLFNFHAVPRSPHTVAEVEKAIYDELEKLKTEPVSLRELEKITNNVEADYIRKLKSNSGLAHYISSYAILLGDWRYMTTYSDRIKEITAEDIMAVATKYFTKNNRTVAILVRPEGKTPEKKASK